MLEEEVQIFQNYFFIGSALFQIYLVKIRQKSKVQKFYLTFPNIFHTFIYFQTISTIFRRRKKLFIYQ